MAGFVPPILTEADADRISAVVAAAEGRSAGEIVTSTTMLRAPDPLDSDCVLASAGGVAAVAGPAPFSAESAMATRSAMILRTSSGGGGS